MNRGMRFLACVAFGVLAIFAVGFVTKSLWNWLVPTLFNGPSLTFWQALGLLFLSKLLFWGFGGKADCRGGRAGFQNSSWKAKFYNKFSSMSPEERELLKQKMREKWCHWEEKGSQKDAPTSND